MFIQSIKSPLQHHYVRVQTINLTNIYSFFHLPKKVTPVFTPLRKQSVIAVCSPAQSSLIKQYAVAITACIAMFFCSCQKGKLSDDTALNSLTSSSASSEAKLKLPFGHGHDKSPVTNYGALIGTPEVADDEDFQLNVADQIGIACLRERVNIPSWSLTADLVPELNTSYHVLLNFCSNGSGDTNEAIPFVSDMVQYKLDLNNTLNTFTVMPVVAVIENEESNRFYYTGSAQDYIDQLKTAIDVMHARGIKTTNGGITNQGLNYLVYEDFLKQGKDDSAKMFQQLTNVTPNNPSTQDRGEFVDELLTAYKRMDLDYVNFHWKASSPDTDALTEVIAYLKKRTDKQIISNELGQFDKDPNTLLSHVKLCDNENFPYLLWYSPDESERKKSTPLQHSDASLTPSGNAYQNYLSN